MREAKRALDEQAELLHPVKPRVLFAALGERHAEQIARVANESGIPTDHLHHSMADSRIRSVRQRFESDSGDLQGVVQLRMLGQGYDFPPIAVVVPFRPYGSFGEFYQFVGRGIRIVNHPALAGRVGPGEQSLDLVYYAELGLDEHIRTVYEENEMEPLPMREPDGDRGTAPLAENEGNGMGVTTSPAERPETFVLFERGAMERRVLHDAERVEQRRQERERETFAQAYAAYAASTPNPVNFDRYVDAIRRMHG